MVARGNPLGIRTLSDLARAGVRFVNRDHDSGTRLLFDQLLALHDVDESRINGAQQIEFTHAAVAAYVASGMADVAFGFSTELPVSCSNMGDVPPDLPNIDGTPADVVFLRGIDRVATRHALEQRCGLLTVVAGRINGAEVLTFAAYAPGAPNTTAWLRTELDKTLAAFELSGVIE